MTRAEIEQKMDELARSRITRALLGLKRRYSCLSAYFSSLTTFMRYFVSCCPWI